jgi:methionine synthase II (cobalamin-independent)
MFATLLGSLPRPPLPDNARDHDLVTAAVRAQEAAGLEPLTDGGLRDDESPLAAWLATAGLTDRAVKQVLAGPYTAGHAAGGDAAARTALTLDLAARGNAVIRELATAGCPLVEVHEPAAAAIGMDEAERALFREAHLRLLDGVRGTHPSLAIVGGSAHEAGIDTILAASYASLAVDLIAGPDNWKLVAVTPGECGVVCGALQPAPGTNDGPELLLWAASYAASTKGRGPGRVGLATASSLAALDWPAAAAKLEALGRVIRLAEGPVEERLAAFDPRAVSSRAAALGTVDVPPPTSPPRDDEAT